MPRAAGIVTCGARASRPGSELGGDWLEGWARRGACREERVCPEAPTAHPRDLSAGLGSGPSPPACSGWGGRAWSLSDPAPTAGRRQPRASPSPTRMEILDEFDSEFPQSVIFCQRISEEAFERQAATYTERALRRLFRSLDRNPALAERVVRKGKQAECERRGLLSFLWVRDAGGAAGGWGGGPRVGTHGARWAGTERGLGPEQVFAELGLGGARGNPGWGGRLAGRRLTGPACFLLPCLSRCRRRRSSSVLSRGR